MAILADSFYYQELRIDTINTRVFADLIAKEGDANGRGLLVTLTENGLVKNTTGIALNLKWEHTSVGNQGLDNFEAVDLSKGLYKITYPTEMLNRGKVRAFIQIVDSGKLAGVRNVEITVDRGVGDDTAIASSDSFTALAQALIDVNNLESTYAPELLSVKQQLEQAATKAELSAIATPKAVSLASQMTDVAKIYVYMGAEGGYTAGNWYYHNGTVWVSGGVYQATAFADSSVTVKNTNFFDSRVNLFDKTTVTADKIANPAWGGLDTVVGYSASDYIPVVAGFNYMISKTAYVAFFDNAHSYLSGLTSPAPSGQFTVITPPVNCAYVRVSPETLNLNTFMFVNGAIDSTFDYVSYGMAHIKKEAIDKFNAPDKINVSTVTKDLCDFTVPSRNLFNKDTVTLNKLPYPYNDASKGLLVDNADCDASDWIAVEPSTQYTKNFLGSGVYYDANKVYISGFDNSVGIVGYVMTTPASAAYMRLSISHIHSLSACQFEKGSVPTDLQTYGVYYLDKQIVLPASTPSGGSTVDLYGRFHPLRCLFFGDSHTEQRAYTTQIQDKVGFTYADVNGLGGSCIANVGTVSSFVERYAALHTNTEFVVVYGGDNDYIQNVVIENVANKLDNTTFKGAIREIIEFYGTNYPEKYLFFVTPTNCYKSEYAAAGYKNTLGLLVSDYAQAMREVCEEYSVPVVDLNRNININEKNYATLLEDGVHLTTETNKRVAQMIISKFEEVYY